MNDRRPVIAGNWKMNGVAASLAELDALVSGLGAQPSETDVVICPPATLIARAAMRAAGSAVRIGGQDCHAEPGGAHTGDISAEMLRDAGAAFVILGHSERRTDHHETDAEIRAKALAARQAGLVAIICIGETLAQREAGDTLPIIAGQIAGSVPADARASDFVLAYEPVWAIGTGKTPTLAEIEAAHGFIRGELERRIGVDARATRLLYGGSVKPTNAAEILALPDVDGALVGGASLKAADFLPIIRAV